MEVELPEYSCVNQTTSIYNSEITSFDEDGLHPAKRGSKTGLYTKELQNTKVFTTTFIYSWTLKRIRYLTDNNSKYYPKTRAYTCLNEN